NKHYKSYIFALVFLCATLAVFGVAAQSGSEQATKQKESQQPAQQPAKQPAQQPAKQGAQQNDDEPVAITERVKVEKPLGAKQITVDQFGVFRPPVINNRGDVAFVSMFKSAKDNGAPDQSIFVRGADGDWKITRQGEKAENLAKGIYGFGGLFAND